MPLKFKCAKCEKEIVVKFLKKGEIAKCRFCGAEVIVPEDAIDTEEEVTYTHIPIGKEQLQGKEEPASLSIVPFSSGHLRAKMLIFILVLGILLALAAVGSTYFQIRLIHKAMVEGGVTLEEGEANWKRQETVWSFKFLTFISTIVVLLFWVYRVHRNLPALRAYGLRFPPGKVLRYWFNNIALLYRPYQVVKEIWKASDPNVDISDGLSWQNAKSSSTIGWWHFLWITSIPISYMGFLISLETKTVNELLTFSWIMLFSEVLFIVASNLLVLIVREVDARQEEKNKRVKRLGLFASNPIT
jgi:DNA-directed RNA polymerase subunit RPC12/RpoP